MDHSALCAKAANKIFGCTRKEIVNNMDKIT